VQAGEADDGELEPPVPPGLLDLSGPTLAAAEFLRIDGDLLAAAAVRSADMRDDDNSQAELAAWMEGLPAAEKGELLLQVAQGEGMQVQSILRRRFRVERSAGDAAFTAGKRTAGELREAAAAQRAARERAAAEKLAAERARKAQAAAENYGKRLDDLALRQEQAWQQVNALIVTKRPRDYDQAVDLLNDLRALSQRDGHDSNFTARLRQLREQHFRQASLLQRLDRAGLHP
jgi:hypothetical protein